MKKLSEIQNDAYLVIEPSNYDAIIMDKARIYTVALVSG